MRLSLCTCHLKFNKKIYGFNFYCLVEKRQNFSLSNFALYGTCIVALCYAHGYLVELATLDLSSGRLFIDFIMAILFC